MHPMNSIKSTALIVCALTLAFVAAAAATGCSGAGEPSRRTGVNILLITLDTTRADRIGAYGYSKGRTPSLDGLAERGVLFEEAYASSVLTLPSHASILTGLLPPAHAVRDNGTDRLPAEVESLAEIFEGAGYRTGAFLSAAVLEAMHGLDQGFATYDDATSRDARFTVAYPERDAGAVTDAALAWLSESADEPWFLWVHYFDPHAPLKPPEPFAARFSQNPYDGEVAYMDSAIGRLLAGAGGVPGGEPLVVVVGDHGEGLGDHGEHSHGVFLYDETARVPLIMKGPGVSASGSRVGEVVRITDVAPTVVDLAGLPPISRVDGVSLRPHLEGRPRENDLAAYSEAIMPATMYGWSPLAAVRLGKWKYVHAPRPELYDMDSDPDELSDLSADRPEVVTELRARLETILAEASRGAPKTTTTAPDADQVERLRSLGYVSGGGDLSFRQALSSDPMTLLAGAARGMIDPKERVGKLTAIETVMRAYGTGRLDEAIPLALGLLKDNPSNMLVRRYLASAYRRRGDHDLALAEFRTILAAQPDNTDALIGAGWILMRMEKMDEARAAYRRVLAINPRSVDAISSLGSLDLVEGNFQGARERFLSVLEARPNHIQSILTLSRIAESQGNRDEAVEFLDQVHAIDPGNMSAFMNRSRIEFQGGDVEAALATLDEAATRHPDRGEVNFGRGNILMQAGRLDEAESAFQKAALQAPEVPHGFHGMGLVAAARGDRTTARRWFTQALKIAPGFPDSARALQQLGP